MTRETVYLIGDRDAVEFAAANTWLRRRFDVCDFVSAAEVPRDGSPRAVILVQQRPGQFAAADVAALLPDFPASAVIHFQGPLCDGDGRTGRATPGVTRVAWRHWESELAAAFAGPPEQRPANDVERLLSRPRFQRHALPSGAVGVYAPSSAAADAVADAVRGCGGTATIAADLAPVTLRNYSAVIIDLDGSSSVEDTARRAFAFAGPPLIVITAFARCEETAAWKERGAAAVISKPFPISELERALAVVADAPRRTDITAA